MCCTRKSPLHRSDAAPLVLMQILFINNKTNESTNKSIEYDYPTIPHSVQQSVRHAPLLLTLVYIVIITITSFEPH